MQLTSQPERIRRLLYDALIVPGAHTRVFDSGFQLELYEVFHTTTITRVGHLLCTLIANISLLALATAVPFIPSIQLGWLTLDGAVLAAAITLAAYLAVHGKWTLVLAPVLAVSVALAHMLGAALGPRLVPGAFAIAYAAAFVQTLSHAFEPVPPPWSGSYRWITLKEFLARTPRFKVVALSAVSILVFPVLELWASPRIWPVQVAQLGMKAGLQPVQARRMHNRVQTILSDARKGWAMPSLKSNDADGR